MNMKDFWHARKCFGSTTVGPRGQAVIPANARKELGIQTGDTLLVFDILNGHGLALLKTDTVEQLINLVMGRVANFERFLKDSRSLESASRKEKD